MHMFDIETLWQDRKARKVILTLFCIGVLIIGILNNGLNLMGINSNWQYIVKGAVILMAVYVDFIRNARKSK